MRTLSYWVFTSGEEGVHGLDWGVKYASPVLGNPHDLDGRYRALLSEFSLSPNLERPDGGVGLLLLPWQSGTLLGFVFPGQDLKGRPNTIAILCVVPVDLRGSISIRETARRIWSGNDLREISQRGTSRPVSLVIGNEPAPSESYPFVASSALMNWPTQEKGYFSINSNIRELPRVSPSKNEERLTTLRASREETTQGVPTVKKSGKKMWLVAACLVLALAIGGYTVCSSDPDSDAPTPSLIPQKDTPEQTELKKDLNHSVALETSKPASVDSVTSKSSVIENFLLSIGDSDVALDFYKAGALARVDVDVHADSDFSKKKGFILYDKQDKEQYVMVNTEALKELLRSYNSDFDDSHQPRLIKKDNEIMLSINSYDHDELERDDEFFEDVEKSLSGNVLHHLEIEHLKCDEVVPEFDAEATSLALYFKTRDEGLSLVAVGQRDGICSYYLYSQAPIVKREVFIGHRRNSKDGADGDGLMGQIQLDSKRLILYFFEEDNRLEVLKISNDDELNKVLQIFIEQLLQHVALLSKGGA